MLEDKNQTGASNPQDHVNDQIKGELLATLAVLKSTHDLERQELAWLVMSALERHLKQHEALEDWVQFTASLSRMATETIEEVDRILCEDAKDNERYH